MSEDSKEIYCFGCWKHKPLANFTDIGSKDRPRCNSCADRIKKRKSKDGSVKS